MTSTVRHLVGPGVLRRAIATAPLPRRRGLGRGKRVQHEAPQHEQCDNGLAILGLGTVQS